MAVKTEFVPGSPRIAYVAAGSGDVILFMHGIGGNKSNWSAQIDFFSAHGRAVAWDARGYGESDDAAAGFPYAAYADDVARLLDHLNTERAHLVGLSMGGRIAMEVHQRHPGRLRSLAICNSSPGLVTLSSDEKAEFLRLRQAPLLAGKKPAELAPALAERILGKSPTEAARHKILASLSALRTDSYLYALKVNLYAPAYDDFERIAVPAIFIASDEDVLAPIDVSRHMAARTPKSRLEVITGAGHLSNIEQPETFNAILFSFLKSTEGGRG